MNKLNALYDLRERIPKFIKKIFPKFLKRKINKKFFKYYFLPTTMIKLPNSNYQEEVNLEYQKNLIKKFSETKKNSFMTCPHLIQLLLMKFNSNDNYSFLDIGGEKIDFYLKLKKNFGNVKYYIFNLKPVVKVFKELKLQFNFNDLHIIDNIEEIFNKNFDFVNFGSCIQYFDNYENVLDKISDNSKFIFFSGTTLYSSSDDNLKKNIIVKQMNVLPKMNYLYFFNKKKFYEIFTKKGFNLVFEEKNLTDNINYDNFKKYLNNIEYTDFLFTKN
tara:strand:+ start:7207 stop:8028 length:822 start_codon:yes stop_codon:yes gene_type:complete